MGLTLHYELHLPAETSRESVAAKLRDLHAFAATLPFEHVSALVVDDSENLVTDSEAHAALMFWASIVANPLRVSKPALTADPDSAMGFFVRPGKDCEPAWFGFLRRSNTTGAGGDWSWNCSCKTQYASNVSEAHFVTCHTSLVQLLDRAVACGIQADVHDESHYWETRDEVQLVASVRDMNVLVAGLAGHFSDTLGDEHTVEAPIFAHPRFERLEMGETD